MNSNPVLYVLIGIFLGSALVTGYNITESADYGEQRSFVKIKYVADCGKYGLQEEKVWYDADKRSFGRQLMAEDIYAQKVESQLAAYSSETADEITCVAEWKQVDSYTS